METYNYDESGTASLSSMENGMNLPSSDADSGMPAEPGFGPAGSVTPSLPETNNEVPASPGFGPVGPVTPSLPSAPSSNGRPGGSTIMWPNNNMGILWTWGTLSPFFSTSSEVSHLRFYNAAAIQEPLDIYLNGRLVVSELDYMNYTRFLHILPGVYRLTVYRRTNPGFAIINTNIRLNSGTSYTLTILGTIGNYSIQMMAS